MAGVFNDSRKHTFVDLAANDARVFSNTFRLEVEHGWEGICIEANSDYLSDLAKRRCHVVAAVVTDATDQSVTFSMPPVERGGIGAITNLGLKNHQASPSPWDRANRRVTFRTVTLEAIFRRLAAPPVIDYLSLDIEGAEFIAMKSFPFDRYTFRLMTVERPDKDLRKHLAAHGYLFAYCLTDFGETLYAHKSVLAMPQTHHNLQQLIRGWSAGHGNGVADTCWLNRMHPAAPAKDERYPGIVFKPAHPGDELQENPQWILAPSGLATGPKRRLRRLAAAAQRAGGVTRPW